MGLVAVMEPDLEVGFHAGAVVVLRGAEVIRTLPLHAVGALHVYGAAALRPAARSALLAREIPVWLLGADGRPLGRLGRRVGAWGQRRLAQAALDPARRLAIGRALLLGRLAQERELLMDRQRELRSPGLALALAGLRGAGMAAEEASDPAALQTVSASASARYGAGLGLREGVRSELLETARRAAHALVEIQAAGAVLQAGLDRHIGFLNAGSPGRPGLVLDLCAEFLPMADRLVLGLVNRRQLVEADLESDLPGSGAQGAEAQGAEAQRLTRVGQRILLRAWLARIAERAAHPMLEQGWDIAALFGVQAQQLRRIIEEPEAVWRPIPPGSGL